MGANMSLTCNPPIGHSATLTLPPTSTPDGDIECVFTASFDSADARAQARNAGARLELWSDIPWAGHGYGQWHALSFAWADEAKKAEGKLEVTPVAPPLGDVPPVLSHPELVTKLVPTAKRATSPTNSNVSAPSSPISSSTTVVDAADATDAMDEEKDKEPDLVLRFGTHFPTPIWGGPLRFCYTYRLVYPDGGMQWLGEFGKDGELFVERKVEPGQGSRRGSSVGRRTPLRTPLRTPARTPSPQA
jgi:hypothetical protein